MRRALNEIEFWILLLMIFWIIGTSLQGILYVCRWTGRYPVKHPAFAWLLILLIAIWIMRMAGAL